MKKRIIYLAIGITVLAAALLIANLVLVKKQEKKKAVVLEKVKVVRVIDGDTIEIEGGRRLRYLGIDTPEMNFYGKKAECFAYEATKRNKELVLNQEVEIERVVSDTDKYGRILRFVFLEGKLVSKILVEEGMGRVENIAPDAKYLEELARVEQAAREGGVGLWGKCDK